MKFFYAMQKDETEQQSRRMTWILLSQTIIFAGLSNLVDEKGFLWLQLKTVSVIVLILVGFSVAVSGAYSMVVGDLAISRIFGEKNKYGATKNMVTITSHWMMTVPSVVLNSSLNFLSLYTFVPKTFLSAWLTIAFSLFLIHKGTDVPLYYLVSGIYFCVLCMTNYLYKQLFNYQRNKMEKYKVKKSIIISTL